MTARIAFIAAALAAGVAAAPAAAQSRADDERWQQAQRRFDQERAIYERERDRYDEARRRYSGGYADDYDSRYATDWDAADYYRDDPRYRERTLSASDQVYRGSDGRYYCRRSDGTAGLIIGGAAGGVLGNVIDGGRNRAAGTLIGGALGALFGREVERQQVRCR